MFLGAERKIKAIAIPAALLLFAVFTVSFFNNREESYSLYSTFRESMSYVSWMEVHVNGAFPGRSAEVPGESGEEEGSRGENFYSLVFLLGSAAFLNAHLFLIAAFLAAAVSLSSFLLSDIRKRNTVMRSRLKHYKAWSLKFLTPLQKSILNRSDEYDINPVYGLVGVCKPVFWFKPDTGFFYGVKRPAL